MFPAIQIPGKIRILDRYLYGSLPPLKRYADMHLRPFALTFAAAALFVGTVRAQPPVPSHKYAVLAGVKKYDHAGLPPLLYSENDVAELDSVLRAAAG